MTNAKNNSGVAIETCSVATCEPGENCTLLSTLFFSFPQPRSPPSRTSTGTPDLTCSFAQPCCIATAFFAVPGDGTEGHFNLSSIYLSTSVSSSSLWYSFWVHGYLVCWPSPAPSLGLVWFWAVDAGSERNGSSSCSSSTLLPQCTARFSLLSICSGGRESVVNFLRV